MGVLKLLAVIKVFNIYGIWFVGNVKKLNMDLETRSKWHDASQNEKLREKTVACM